MDLLPRHRNALAAAVVVILALAAAVVPSLTTRAQQPAPQPALTVTVSPSSGPSGTTATINISGARPGDPITIIIGGNGITNATADAQGRASITHTFFGRPGDVVSIVATAGTGADDRTGATSFRITGETDRQGVLLYPGMNVVTYTGPTLPVERALGSAARNVSIIWQFNPAAQAWQFWTSGVGTIAALQTGVPYVIFAKLAEPWDFPPPPGWKPLNVIVEPSSGPSGTSATITVTGLTPGDEVEIDIGPPMETITQVVLGTPVTLRRQFSGQPGQVIAIIANGPPSAGDPYRRVASATFAITGAATPTPTAPPTDDIPPPLG